MVPGPGPVSSQGNKERWHNAGALQFWHRFTSLEDTKLHEWRVYLQRWFLGFKGMRSVRTLRQKRRSSTKLGSKNCVTIFGAEFGSAAAEYGPIRKKLWRQPSSFKQYFQTKLCTKKMWQNRLRFGRDVHSLNTSRHGSGDSSTFWIQFLTEGEISRAVVFWRLLCCEC